MNTITSEVEKNIAKKVIDSWDGTGLSFFLALISTIAFCFATIFSADELAVFLQLFGISVLYLMMWRVPVYYIATGPNFSGKSSASLGLTICFAILTALLVVRGDDRDVFYYFGLIITLLFALLMVWGMNVKSSRVNVRKTFTASTVALLAQCVFASVLLSGGSPQNSSKLGIQAFLTTTLLIICIYRMVKFLRNRDSIEKAAVNEIGSDDA